MAMPVYNGAAFVRSAIESILAQEFSDFELVITDNASDDATPDICSELARTDDRIRYFRNASNIGAAPNYNLGFEHARGEYLKWCAHDDLLSANYVAACLEALEKDSGASLAFGRTLCIDQEGAVIEGDDNAEMAAVIDPSPTRRFMTAIRSGGTCFPIFGLFRKATLERTTLHRRYYGSDRALIAEAAFLGRCLLVPDAIFFNREHATRSIRMVDRADRSKWQNGETSRIAAMEQVQLLRHLAEVAVRHPDVASPIIALPAVAYYAMSPRIMARIALDLARCIAPSGAVKMRNLVMGVAESEGRAPLKR